MSYFSKLRAARQLRRFRRFRENLLIEFLRNPNSDPDHVRQFFLEVNQTFNDSEVGHKQFGIDIPTLFSLVAGGSRESKTEDGS